MEQDDEVSGSPDNREILRDRERSRMQVNGHRLLRLTVVRLSASFKLKAASSFGRRSFRIDEPRGRKLLLKFMTSTGIQSCSEVSAQAKDQPGRGG